MSTFCNRFAFLIWILLVGILISGCVRLFGQAGYVKQTPQERTERVVGFDTAKVFEDQQAKGSIAT